MDALQREAKKALAKIKRPEGNRKPIKSEPFEVEGKTYRVVSLWHGGTRVEEVAND